MDLSEERFVRKWQLKERAEEDVYFAARDQAALRALREGNEEENEELIREVIRMRCPECGARLDPMRRRGVTVERCPLGHGMWMTDAELRTLARRERYSWIGRYLYRPRLK